MKEGATASWMLSQRQIVFILLAAIGIPVGFLLNYFGYVDVVVNGDSSIFSGLIASAFTLAGLTIAAVAFSSDTHPDIAKDLLGPTVSFLMSGFLMYSNILISEVQRHSFNYSSNALLVSYFDVNTIVGMVGVVVYFVSIAFLIVVLLNIRSHLPS